MSKDLLVAHIRRMQSEADARLADAALLMQSGRVRSDAAYLLELLAFEILLKAAVQIYLGSPGRSHSYRKVFNSLPELIRKRVIERAEERMCDAANYGAVDDLLDVFERNFIQLRYPYEIYEGLSESEFKRLGKEWKDAGAPTDKAKFVYHPLELEGLIHGLQAVLGSWLAAA